ncbi:ABC transporter ATP-binding protein [Motiliproteus sp. SC1-56]|uniref:ABC transporter ATP-binding protein n=1 Tax=Motiliproteus sp. SC1-56 TaxID=2799565 RepID=UPI001A8FA218|nr:ABC transporter ATP-binding protein [Motiliproteus sp. SC1-56]
MPDASIQAPSGSQAILRVRELAKRVPTQRGELTILNGLSLVVNPGESLAILGASGCGKSTLLGLLAGLDSASAGEIELDGQRIDNLDEDQRARVRRGAVGFVFQNFQLLPALTALENVMLPLELANEPRAREEALLLLERVGLGQRDDHYPRHLSGGEQQRVAIARAFASRPRVLFADEPTGNLDPATGERVIELLFELNAEQGTTLILVTHDSHLARRCQRRLELREGTLRPLT